MKTSNYYILSHRCGGRNSDRLPVSENSLAMVRFTEQLGTTGIECDPRISSDGVVFIYYDPDINTRLTQKGPPLRRCQRLFMETIINVRHSYSWGENTLPRGIIDLYN